MAKKLYVGNLSYEVTEADLNALFSQCGQVSEAKIILDKETGRSKGFGFVEMINDDEAAHAVDRMRGYDLKGRELVVDLAQGTNEGAAKPGGPNAGSGPVGRGGGGRHRR